MIYDHPTDWPDHYVVRRWFIVEGNLEPVPDTYIFLANTLEAARAMIPSDLFCNPGDPDPKILEVWM